MDVLQLVAENKIKTAQAEGAFDNLEGKGRPIILEESQPAGDDRFMANHILKTNNFLPVWLEDRKKLQQEISSCSETLLKGMAISEEKQEAIRQLNQRISGYNLRVPVYSLRLMPVPVPEK